MECSRQDLAQFNTLGMDTFYDESNADDLPKELGRREAIGWNRSICQVNPSLYWFLHRIPPHIMILNRISTPFQCLPLHSQRKKDPVLLLLLLLWLAVIALAGYSLSRLPSTSSNAGNKTIAQPSTVDRSGSTPNVKTTAAPIKHHSHASNFGFATKPLFYASDRRTTTTTSYSPPSFAPTQVPPLTHSPTRPPTHSLDGGRRYPPFFSFSPRSYSFITFSRVSITISWLFCCRHACASSSSSSSSSSSGFTKILVAGVRNPSSQFTDLSSCVFLFSPARSFHLWPKAVLSSTRSSLCVLYLIRGRGMWT